MESENSKYVCTSCGGSQENESGMCCGTEMEKVCSCGSDKGENACDCKS